MSVFLKKDLHQSMDGLVGAPFFLPLFSLESHPLPPGCRGFGGRRKTWMVACSQHLPEGKAWVACKAVMELDSVVKKLLLSLFFGLGM